MPKIVQKTKSSSATFTVALISVSAISVTAFYLSLRIFGYFLLHQTQQQALPLQGNTNTFQQSPPSPSPTPSPTPSPSQQNPPACGQCLAGALPENICSPSLKAIIDQINTLSGTAQCENDVAPNQFTLTFDTDTGKILSAQAMFQEGSCFGWFDEAFSLPGIELSTENRPCENAVVCGKTGQRYFSSRSLDFTINLHGA